MTFKDPETGAHTSSIESTWRAAKAITANGRKKRYKSGNLARYKFLKGCKERKADTFVEFLRLAGLLYDPTAGRTEEDLPLFGEGEIDSDDELESQNDLF